MLQYSFRFEAIRDTLITPYMPVFHTLLSEHTVTDNKSFLKLLFMKKETTSEQADVPPKITLPHLAFFYFYLSMRFIRAKKEERSILHFSEHELDQLFSLQACIFNRWDRERIGTFEILTLAGPLFTALAVFYKDNVPQNINKNPLSFYIPTELKQRKTIEFILLRKLSRIEMPSLKWDTNIAFTALEKRIRFFFLLYRAYAESILTHKQNLKVYLDACREEGSLIKPYILDYADFWAEHLQLKPESIESTEMLGAFVHEGGDASTPSPTTSTQSITNTLATASSASSEGQKRTAPEPLDKPNRSAKRRRQEAEVPIDKPERCTEELEAMSQGVTPPPPTHPRNTTEDLHRLFQSTMGTKEETLPPSHGIFSPESDELDSLFSLGL